MRFSCIILSSLTTTYCLFSILTLSFCAMSTRPVFRFGIEVEAVVEPFKVRPEWQDQPHLYYERLAQALRNRNLPAVADDRLGQYRAQHPEHYDAWFITADGSLRGTGNQGIISLIHHYSHHPNCLPIHATILFVPSKRLSHTDYQKFASRLFHEY